LKLLFPSESLFFSCHRQIETLVNRLLRRRSGCKTKEVTDGRRKLHSEFQFVLASTFNRLIISANVFATHAACRKHAYDILVEKHL
jgi:hypothetical protein